MTTANSTVRVKLFRRGDTVWLRLPRPVDEGIEAGQAVEIFREGDKIIIETDPSEIEGRSHQQKEARR